MKLLGVDHSRLTALFLASRVEGQPAIPGAFGELIKRYSFTGFPTKIEELDANRTSFRLGSFNGVGIEYFDIYSDGVVAGAKAPTDVLDAFVADVTEWMDVAFGLKRVETHTINRLYESTVLVESDAPLLKALETLRPIQELISASLKAAIGLEAKFEPFGLSMATDHSRLAGLRPIAFKVERRAGIEFDKHYYFSAAPLRTADHLKVLEQLEKLAMRD